MRITMAMQRAATAMLATIGLAGCVVNISDGDGSGDSAEAVPPPPPPSPTPTGKTCNAEKAQHHVGHDATQAMGGAILKDSGARTLRWGPPDGVWTMDYREDRVNVRYDEKMKITAVSCG